MTQVKMALFLTMLAVSRSIILVATSPFSPFQAHDQNTTNDKVTVSAL
jgi:hypothetical protein